MATFLLISVSVTMLAIDVGVIAVCIVSSRRRARPLPAGRRLAAQALGLVYLVLLAVAMALLIVVEFTKPSRTALSGFVELVLVLFPIVHFAILIVSVMVLFRKPQLVAGMAASAIAGAAVMAATWLVGLYGFQSGPDLAAGLLAFVFTFAAFACGPVVGLPLGWWWFRRASEPEG
ncbi:MAG: hypothetical protein FJ288_07840 [Planctomycetes bacterium]|nr:hypothetical protein [Planctomycetota bacterium]